MLIMRPFFAFRAKPLHNEARPRKRSDRGRFLPYAKMPLHTGVRTGCHYLICLSVCVCVYVTFVVFTDCESCTWSISTNSGSMEAGECGRARGACFIARHLEVVEVAGLMWVSWCAFGGARFFSSSFFSDFFSSNAHGLLQA